MVVVEEDERLLELHLASYKLHVYSVFNFIIIKHLHVYKCSHGLVQGVRPVHTFIQAFIFFLRRLPSVVYIEWSGR